MLAAPIAGALFDASGARPLYGLAMVGYGIGATILWLTRQHEEKTAVLSPDYPM